MAQNRIMINGEAIWQPDKGLKYSFETTYTEDSARVQSGTGYFTPMFTVEQLGYNATHISQAEANKILKHIIYGHKFTLHYFSLFYARWQDAPFYVGKGDCEIGLLIEGGEYLDSLTFNMTGVNPI